MLASLGLNGLVCGHNKYDQVDPSHSCQHVSHETLVARHVNEANTYSFAEVQVGEAKVNRNSALLLFLQPVGINARQRQH